MYARGGSEEGPAMLRDATLRPTPAILRTLQEHLNSYPTEATSLTPQGDIGAGSRSGNDGIFEIWIRSRRMKFTANPFRPQCNVLFIHKAHSHILF